MAALLGLGTHRKDQAEHQGRLPPVPSKVADQQRFKAHHVPPLPTGCLLGLITERAFGSTWVV